MRNGKGHGCMAFDRQDAMQEFVSEGAVLKVLKIDVDGCCTEAGAAAGVGGGYCCTE
jgi:hypothetical protein